MFPSLGRNNRLLMFSLLLWALGEGLWYANLRPIFIEELGATPAQVGLVLTIGGIARALFLIPGGWLSDRYGPRTVMLASWLLGIVGAATMAAAPDWQWFIPGEFLYGVTYFVIPALNSYALQAVPAQATNQSFERTLTTIYASFPAGLIVSQPLGGLIADQYGIRTTFWIGIGLIMLSTVVMFRLPAYPAQSDASRANWRILVRSRSLLVLLAFFFLVTLSMTLGWPLSSIFLHDELGYSLSWVGVFTALMSGGTVILNLVIGRLRPRWGLPTTLALTWLAMLILLQLDVPVLVGAAFLLMGAIYTAHHLMSAAMARRATPSQRGLAFGLSELSFSVALALVPRIAGTLYEVRPRLPFLASFLFIPLTIVLSVVLLRVLKSYDAPEVSPSAEGGA